MCVCFVLIREYIHYSYKWFRLKLSMLIDSDNDDHAEKNCKDKKESAIEREREMKMRIKLQVGQKNVPRAAQFTPTFFPTHC